MYFAVFDDPGAAAQTPKRHFFQLSLSIAGDRKYPIFLCQKKARNRETIKKRNVFYTFVRVPNSRQSTFLNLERFIKYEILVLFSQARRGPK